MRVNVRGEGGLEARAATGARGWTIAEGVVVMLAIASLITTALPFVGGDWLFDHVRWLQKGTLWLR